jgi:hypothetical protein
LRFAGQKCFEKKANSAYYGLIVIVNGVSLSLTIRATILRSSAGNARPPLYSQIIKARLFPNARR